MVSMRLTGIRQPPSWVNHRQLRLPKEFTSIDWKARIIILGIGFVPLLVRFWKNWIAWRANRGCFLIEATFGSGPELCDSIFVTARNHSPFPLMLESIYLKQHGLGDLQIYCLGLPVTVEPGEPFTLSFSIQDNVYDFSGKLLRVTAKTACGLRARSRVK